MVSGQSLAATAVGKTSFFTISNVTGSVEDVEVSVEGESQYHWFMSWSTRKEDNHLQPESDFRRLK